MALTTTVIALPGATFLAGTNVFGPVSIAAGVFAVEAHFAPAIYLSATLIMTLTLEISQDSGATWLPGGSFVTRGIGSVPLDRGGIPATDSWLRASVPNPGNANRQVRGTATLNELITTYLRIVQES